MKTQITEFEKRCGNCSFWMTSICPQEPDEKKNINPVLLTSCNTFPCEKYNMSHMYELKSKEETK